MSTGDASNEDVKDLEAQVERMELHLSKLNSMNANHAPSRRWTKREIAEIAPRYSGYAEKFSLAYHICNVRKKKLQPLLDRLQRARDIEKRKLQGIPDSASAEPYQPGDLHLAIRSIFHSSCPHPYRFYTETGLDKEAFVADLKSWIAEVVTIWQSLDDTQHHAQCACCISFKRLATNWDTHFSMAMTKEEYTTKTVSRSEIIRWGNMISGDSAKAAFESIRQVARDLITDTDSRRVSDVTTDSSAVDSDDGLPYVPIPEPAEDREAEENTSQTPTSKQNQIRARGPRLPRPLHRVYEVTPNVEDELHYALPELQKVAKVSIAGLDTTGRVLLGRFSKVFFQNMLRVTTQFASWPMVSKRYLIKVIANEDLRLYQLQELLYDSLHNVRNQYTTRSRKRAKQSQAEG